MFRKLDDGYKGGDVLRGAGVPFAKPSIYSRELRRILYQHLTSKPIDQPLLLTGCFLNPLFREMEFISD